MLQLRQQDVIHAPAVGSVGRVAGDLHAHEAGGDLPSGNPENTGRDGHRGRTAVLAACHAVEIVEWFARTGACGDRFERATIPAAFAVHKCAPLRRSARSKSHFTRQRDDRRGHGRACRSGLSRPLKVVGSCRQAVARRRLDRGRGRIDLQGGSSTVGRRIDWRTGERDVVVATRKNKQGQNVLHDARVALAALVAKLNGGADA